MAERLLADFYLSAGDQRKVMQQSVLMMVCKYSCSGIDPALLVDAPVKISMGDSS